MSQSDIATDNSAVLASVCPVDIDLFYNNHYNNTTGELHTSELKDCDILLIIYY